MSSKWRRYEVLLPLQFNDGRGVPGEWLAESILEIVENFGAASYETQKVEGHWRAGGILYRDNLVKIVVDVPDSANTKMQNKRRSMTIHEMTRSDTKYSLFRVISCDLVDRLLPLFTAQSGMRTF